MDDDSFEQEIAKAQDVVKKRRSERDDLRRKFESRERRATRLSNLYAEADKLEAEIEALKGGTQPDSPETDQPDEEDEHDHDA